MRNVSELVKHLSIFGLRVKSPVESPRRSPAGGVSERKRGVPHSENMSATENQNGTAGGTQSNGIKTLSSSSSSSSTASSTTSGVSPSSGGRVGLPNNSNSSFLYSSSTMLNREKTRQVPPPTLPKYTSSFNAGSNGGSTTERLSRDREAGGSYRLASLDRLALRQRILDGEKANGEPISVSKTTWWSLQHEFREQILQYLTAPIGSSIWPFSPYLFTMLLFCPFFCPRSLRWANNTISNFILEKMAFMYVLSLFIPTQSLHDFFYDLRIWLSLYIKLKIKLSKLDLKSRLSLTCTDLPFA